VLATWHGGIPEAVAHEISGLLVPEKDPDALFAAMQRLTSSRERLVTFGAAAARSVREEFSRERAIGKLEEFYDEARALGENAPRAL
jgi:glycosyltransferase involved in cell wall biosynthesis